MIFAVCTDVVGACNCAQWRVGGAVRLAWTKQSERGGAGSGEKWLHGVPTRPRQSLTSQSRSPRKEHSETSVPSSVHSTRWRAQTGHLPTNTQPLPLHIAFFFLNSAVKCNSSLCGLKTESRHKQRRSETRTHAVETGAASGREVSAPVGVGGNSRHADFTYAKFLYFIQFDVLCKRQGLDGTRTPVLSWLNASRIITFTAIPLPRTVAQQMVCVCACACSAHVVRKRSRKREKTWSLWQKTKGKWANSEIVNKRVNVAALNWF